MSSSSTTNDVVIIGGGIMGLCTSHFLGRNSEKAKRRIHVIEEAQGGVAQGASGKAAGFIAKDWHGAETTALGELSFRLYQELADEMDGARRWGYRRVRSYTAVIEPRRAADAAPTTDRTHDGDQLPLRYLPPAMEGAEAEARYHPWIDPRAVSHRELVGDETTTAQVEPYSFCKTLEEGLVKAGGEVISGRAVAVQKQGGRASAVDVSLSDGSTRSIPCGHVVVAAGPWSGKVVKELFSLDVGIHELAGHSIVFEPPADKNDAKASALPAEAVFASVKGAGGKGLTTSPEVFTRPDGSIYIAGENSGAPLPPSHSKPPSLSPTSLSRLSACAAALSPEHMSPHLPHRTALCYRPVTRRGFPYVCRVDPVPNAYLIAGHGPWGITLAPASGWAMAQLVDGANEVKEIEALGFSTA